MLIVGGEFFGIIRFDPQKISVAIHKNIRCDPQVRLFTDNIRYDTRIDIEIQAATIIGRCGGFASQIFDTGGLKSRQIGSSATAPPQIAQKL